MDSANAVEALVEVSAFWAVSSPGGYVTVRGSEKAVVGAAARALADGHDSPSLRMLAGAPPDTDWWEFRDLVARSLVELGIPFAPDLDGVELLALRFVCRQYLAGEISLREMASWAHAFIGHQGAEVAHDIVMIDDELDIGGVVDWRLPRRRRRPTTWEHEGRRRAKEFLELTNAMPSTDRDTSRDPGGADGHERAVDAVTARRHLTDLAYPSGSRSAASRLLVVLSGVLAGVLLVLGIIGAVTADELGFYSIIVAGLAWMILGIPLLIAAAVVDRRKRSPE